MAHKEPEEIPIVRLIVCAGLFAVGSLAVSIVHACIPERFDLTSVVVAEVAIAPLLIFLFTNVEFGFGEWKVALTPARIQNAFSKVDSLEQRSEEPRSGDLVTDKVPAEEATIPDVVGYRGTHQRPQATRALDYVGDDVVFIRLRREIERRLKAIASQYGIPNAERASASRLLDMLRERQIIGPDEASGLGELIAAGNAQAHGGDVSAGMADLARTDGERLLLALDRIAAQPERALLWEVATRARNAGKIVQPEARGRVGDVPVQADMLIPNELVLEIKQRSDRQSVTSGLLQLLQVATALKVNGLLVLGEQPDMNVASYKQSKDDPRIGVAWRSGAEFDGNQRAHDIAPWLFS